MEKKILVFGDPSLAFEISKHLERINLAFRRHEVTVFKAVDAETSVVGRVMLCLFAGPRAGAVRVTLSLAVLVTSETPPILIAAAESSAVRPLEPLRAE